MSTYQSSEYQPTASEKYDQASKMAPSPIWVFVSTMVVVGASQLVYYNESFTWLALAIVLAISTTAAVALVPRWFHYQHAMRLTHMERSQAVKTETEKVAIARLQLLLVDRQIEYGKMVFSMNRDQLRALSSLPTIARAEDMPWSGTWLVVPPGPLVGQDEVRVIKEWVGEFCDVWIEQVSSGGELSKLPLIGQWSDSRKRDAMRILVMGLADAGLVWADTSGKVWNSNLGARLASGVSVIDAFRWLRMENDYDLTGGYYDPTQHGEDSFDRQGKEGYGSEEEESF